MAHILSYGSLNLDLVYQVPHFVQAGETLSSTSRTVHCGGKGLNQSIAAARAGGTVSHAGKIGGDGTVLTDILRKSGVDTDFVTVGDGPSGHAVIQVDPSGQNCILLFGGCNQEITHEEIDRVLDAVICKNLLLCNRQCTEFYLLMLPGDKHFKTSVLSKEIGSSRLSFAAPEYMEKFLDITPGSVSVLGLMNDGENHVQLLMDEDVLKGEFIGCHPCINTSSLRFRTADLMEKILPAVHHEPRIVTLPQE